MGKYIYDWNDGDTARMLAAFRPELRKVAEDVATCSGVRPEVAMAEMLGLAAIALKRKAKGAFPGGEMYPYINIVGVEIYTDLLSLHATLSRPLVDIQGAARTQYERARKRATPEEKAKILPPKKIFIGATSAKVLRKELYNNREGMGVVCTHGLPVRLGRYKGTGGQSAKDYQFIEAVDGQGFAFEADNGIAEYVDHCFVASVDSIPVTELGDIFGKWRMRGDLSIYFLFSWDDSLRTRRNGTVDISAWTEVVENLLNMDPVTLTPTGAAKRILKENKERIHNYPAGEYFEKWTTRGVPVFTEALAIVLHFLGRHHQSATLTADDVRHAVDFMDYFTYVRAKVTAFLWLTDKLK